MEVETRLSYYTSSIQSDGSRHSKVFDNSMNRMGRRQSRWLGRQVPMGVKHREIYAVGLVLGRTGECSFLETSQERQDRWDKN